MHSRSNCGLQQHRRVASGDHRAFHGRCDALDRREVPDTRKQRERLVVPDGAAVCSRSEVDKCKGPMLRVRLGHAQEELVAQDVIGNRGVGKNLVDADVGQRIWRGTAKAERGGGRAFGNMYMRNPDGRENEVRERERESGKEREGERVGERERDRE